MFKLPPLYKRLLIALFPRDFISVYVKKYVSMQGERDAYRRTANFCFEIMDEQQLKILREKILEDMKFTEIVSL